MCCSIDTSCSTIASNASLWNWKEQLTCSSMHVVCRMWIFFTKLNAFAYFTHKVKLPLLTCAEISDHSQMLHIFPKLYKDISNGKRTTLKDYLVLYKHLPINEPESEIFQEFLKRNCLGKSDYPSLIKNAVVSLNWFETVLCVN